MQDVKKSLWENGVSVQSESASYVLVLMVDVMFHYNQCYIQVLECFLMFSAQAEQYSAHTAQKELIWFTCSAVCYLLLLNTHVQQQCYSEKAKSNKSWTDS